MKSEEFDILMKRITEMVGKVEKLSLEVEHLTTKYHSIRGLVTRKFYPEKEEEEKIKSSTDFHPFMGNNR